MAIRSGGTQSDRHASMFVRKPLDLAISEGLREGKGELQRKLGTFQLTALGVGAIIGTGIFVLTGVAAARFAGPGLVFSFILAGLAAGLAALVYAELASMVPVAGSTYSYAYVTFGEIFAWIIGWDLVLEYSLAGAAVAAGWSGYIQDFLRALGIALPPALATPTLDGGAFNLPAVLVVLAMGLLLLRGTRESATFNAVIVAIKLAVIGLFLFVGIRHFDSTLLRPFLPFGWEGVLNAAALVFFAYIGFDAVATAAEEVRDPGRQLPWGIVLSLVISAALYVAVTGVLVGIVPFSQLDVASPLSFALLQKGVSWASAVIAVGALAGLTSVLLVVLYAQSRIFFAMARDGLLPQALVGLHSKRQSPSRVIILTSVLVGVFAAVMPVGLVAEMANIGTLAAFVFVSVGVIILRYTRPNVKRPFKVPLFPVLPVLAAAASLYLMTQLPALTWYRFVAWLAIGLVIYLTYGYAHSRLHQEA